MRIRGTLVITVNIKQQQNKVFNIILWQNMKIRDIFVTNVNIKQLQNYLSNVILRLNMNKRGILVRFAISRLQDREILNFI